MDDCAPLWVTSASHLPVLRTFLTSTWQKDVASSFAEGFSFLIKALTRPSASCAHVHNSASALHTKCDLPALQRGLGVTRCVLRWQQNVKSTHVDSPHREWVTLLSRSMSANSIWSTMRCDATGPHCNY
jgi:hypothetical protein